MEHQKLGIYGITKEAYSRHCRKFSDLLTDALGASMLFYEDSQTFSIKAFPEIIVSTTEGLSVSVKGTNGDITFTIDRDEYDYAMIEHL